jgi:Isy1-like splicing family
LCSLHSLYLAKLSGKRGKLPIATTRSHVEDVRKRLFRRHEQHSVEQDIHSTAGKPSDILITLEDQRKQILREISESIAILEDERVEMEDQEILSLNEQVNDLIRKKHSIELDIRKMTRGEKDYVTFTDFMFYGRAKKLGEKPLSNQVEIDKTMFKKDPSSEGDNTVADYKSLLMEGLLKKKRKTTE